MRLHRPGATCWAPLGVEEAARGVTHLAVGAHPDDVELMAYPGIDECFGRPDLGFAAVVCTDGAGSPRSGVYERLTDEELREVRRKEQLAAAAIGRYALAVQLDYPSSKVKAPADTRPDDDLVEVLRATSPEVLYTHNPADKHPTHVAVFARTMRALRRLPAGRRPPLVLGCEGWRGLDWLPDHRKVVLDAGGREHLAQALLACFDSQISSGKRYDLAALGRRRANATYLDPRRSDAAGMAVFALDLSPLVNDDDACIASFTRDLIEEFSAEAMQELTLWS